MLEYSLQFPAGFDEYAWEVEAKGWFSEAVLLVGTRRFRLNFYDATRLAQEVASDLENSGVFFDPNLVVVNPVTRQEMEKAARQLVHSGRLDELVPET